MGHQATLLIIIRIQQKKTCNKQIQTGDSHFLPTTATICHLNGATFITMVIMAV